MQSLRFEAPGALLRIFEPGVAAVDEDVAFLEVRRDLLDRLIDRGAGLDHHHDAARPRQRFRKISESLRADELLAAVLADELVDSLRLEIPHRDRKAVLLDVEREVHAHDSEADHPELRLGHRYTFAATAFFTAWASFSSPPSTSSPSAMLTARRLRLASD